MKLRTILFLTGVFCSFSVFAQFTPQGFNYQSIVRDANGSPVLNQSVTMVFTIRSGAPNGPVAYSEKQVVSTNEFGLINLLIGRGASLQGSFGDINWSGGAKFLTVSVETSPNVFDDLGSSELMSVPYALYAQSAGNGGTGGTGDNWGTQTVQTNPTLGGNGTTGSPLAIAQQGAAAGQVLKWNGTEWKPADDLRSTGTNGGTVTQINTGTGLTGGPISTAGTISLSNSGVAPGIYGSATQIPVISVDAQGRVTQVFTVVPQPGTVGINGAAGINVQQNGLNFTITNTGDTDASNDLTNTTVFNGDVTGTASDLQIKANAVGSPELADNAVNNAKLADNAVGNAELANNAVTAGKIANNAVTTDKINNASVTAAKLGDMGATNGQVLKWNGTSWAPQTDNEGATSILSGTGISVSGTAPTFTITNTGDADPSDDITNTSTAGGDLSGTFSALQIRANTVGASEIANNAVGNTEIAGNAITTDKIADAAVTSAKLDDMGATNGQILKWNGTAWAPAADAVGTAGLTGVVAGTGINVSTAGGTATIVNTGDTDPTNDLTTTSTAGGDLQGTFSTLQINNNAVGTAKIANQAITAAKLDNMGAVPGQVLKWNGSTWAPSADEVGTGGVGVLNVAGGAGINVTTAGNTATVVNTGDTNAADDVTQTTAHNGDVAGLYNDLQLKANAVGTTELANQAVTAAKMDDMGASNGQVLKWNGTTWAPAADAVGTGGGGTIAAGAGINVTTAGNTTTVVNTGDTNAADDVTQTTAHNGDVAGPYNDLQLKANSVGTAELASQAITSAKLDDMGAVMGQVLKWSGMGWMPATDEVGGSGGTIAAGAGINVTTAGNTTTVVNTGDTNAADDVTQTTAHNGDVAGPYNDLQLKANAVGTAELADNSVSSAKIATNAVTGIKIINNAITTDKVANQAITAAKLDDMGAVNGQILKWNGSAWAPAADEVGSNNTVNVVGGAGIGVTTAGNTVTVVNTGDADSGDDLTQTTVHNGDVTGPFNDLQLKVGVVTSSELATNAVTTDNIINGAVTGAKINNMSAGIGQVLKWNGSTWAPAEDVAAPSGGDNWGNQTVITSSILSGNGTNANPLSLSQQGAVTGQILKWNGAAWLPANDGGDNWGNQNVVVGGTLAGTGVAANPLELARQGAATGQVLKWNGTSWMPANDGGDNWGTQNVVVSNAFSGNGTAINPLGLAQQGAAAGQVMKWNGTAWLPANDEVGSGGSGGTGNTYAPGAGISITGTAPNFTINNLGDADNSPSNEIQTLSLASGTLSLSNGGGSVVLPGAISYNQGTGINITGTSPNFTISNGGDLSNTNELQSLSLSGSQLSLSNGGGTVVLPTGSSYTGGTAINVTGTAPNFTINNTGDVSATNEIQSLSLAGGQLSLSLGGGSVTLPGANTYAGGTGIAITGTAPNLTIANTGDLSATNELQTISLSGAQLSLSNGGGSVTLPSAITYTAGAGISVTGTGNNRTITNTGDVSNTNEIQTLAVVGNQLSLSNGGGTVTLPTGTTYAAGTGISITGNTINNTGDPSSTNELQTLALAGSVLSISGTASSVDLASLSGGGGLWSTNATNISNNNTGNVGIGTISPTAKLEVMGTAKIVGEKSESHLTIESASATAARIALKNKDSDAWYISAKSNAADAEFAIERYIATSSLTTRVLMIDKDQTVQWGTTANPTNKMLLKHKDKGFGLVLDNVDGTNRTWEFYVNNTNGNLLLFNSTVGPNIPAGTFALNGVYTPSDRRMKKDIQAMKNPVLSKLMQLQPMSYRYKVENESASPSIGFLAQDVQTLFPELVQEQIERNGTNTYLSLNYAGFGVLAVKAVQEQEQEIANLRKDNDTLRKQMETLEARLQQMEKKTRD